MMYVLISVYLFAVGAALGSFAGAVAWRLSKKRDFVRERSECEHCHHQLAWYDLIPLVSWLGLRGKCRYCRKPIGVSALALEVGLGLAVVVSLLVWPYGWGTLGTVMFVLWLVALTLLTILFVYDMRHSLLPDVLIWPLAVLGVAIFIMLMALQGTPLERWLMEAVFALIPVSGVYWVLHKVSDGRWVGFGDVKLGLFIGFVLGWQGALMALLLANYLGLIWVLPGLLSRKLDRSSHMPFGPFLIVATYLVFLWGQPLLTLGKQVLGV